MYVMMSLLIALQASVNQPAAAADEQQLCAAQQPGPGNADADGEAVHSRCASCTGTQLACSL